MTYSPKPQNAVLSAQPYLSVWWSSTVTKKDLIYRETFQLDAFCW